MARQFMGGDFRAISKAAPVAAEPQPDPRLALVDLFRDAQVAQTSGVIDLSGDAPDYGALFEEDAQEPAEPTQPDADDNSPQEAQEAADEAPADAEPVEKVEAQEQVQDEQDYDPIAAVLG